jgi:hypothetical protein
MHSLATGINAKSIDTCSVPSMLLETFVILSDDPYERSEAIDRVEVLKTFVDGQCVYSI